MSKQKLIDTVRNLLNHAPQFIVFRHVGNDHYEYQGKHLTKSECLSIQARQHIFLNRKIVKA